MKVEDHRDVIIKKKLTATVKKKRRVLVYRRDHRLAARYIRAAVK